MTSTATKTKTIIKNVDKVTIGSEQCITETLADGQMVVLPKGVEIVSAWKDSTGALSLQLSNGGMLVIKNYAELAADHAVVLGANNQPINLDKYIAIGEEMQMAALNPQASTLCGLQMGNTDPVRVAIAEMHEVKIPAPAAHKEVVVAHKDPAAEVMDIEPAAGGNNGASGGGFGFQSAYASTPLDGLNAVGGLGGTELAYGANFANPLSNVLGFPLATPAVPTGSLTVTGATLSEDSTTGAQIGIVTPPIIGNQETVITITGINPNWTVNTSVSGGTYNAATGTWTVTVPAGSTFKGSPTFVPPQNSDVDMTVNINSTTRDTSTGNIIATANDTATIVLDAVADAPNLVVNHGSGVEDTGIPLSIATSVTDTDGSEQITKVTISNVPAGATFNHGTNLGGGVWEFSASDLSDLKITPPHNFNGDMNLTVTSTSTEVVLNGQETDLTNNSATTTQQLTVSVTPAPDAPVLVVNDQYISEDGHGQMDITATLTDPKEALTITVTGFGPGWTVDTSTSGGTYNAATGTWSITLPAGQNFHGGPGFTPPANSDADLSKLVVTATSTTTNGLSAATTDDTAIYVDAVADPAALTMQQSYYSPYYGTYQMGLNIAAQVTDTDGSEIITKIVIDLGKIQSVPLADGSGLPNGTFKDLSLAELGATLNKGVEVSPGVWEITVNGMNASSALSGLAINMPQYMGAYWHAGLKFDVPVSVYTHEEFLNGGETNYTNNDAVTTSSFQVEIYWSPLVLDLDGNGQIDLVGQDAGVMFDMTNDGIADKTTWVKGTDGLLALDLNGDGVINNQNELFGDSKTARDGFADLAQHDSNGDGKIDANDQVYSKLLVWQDLNQDGISQANELHTLKDLGIASINLGSTEVNQKAADGVVWLQGSFTYEDGRTGNISDALFNVDAAANDRGMVLQGTAGNETIMGTAHSDVIVGMGGKDIAFGGAGADRFVLSNDGSMKIMDFNIAQGDKIDLGNMLHNLNSTDAISKYVHVVQDGANTLVQVDATGTGHFTTAAVLNNVHASLEDLVSHGSIVVGHGGNAVTHVGGEVLNIADVLTGTDPLAGVFGHTAGSAGVAAPAGSAAPAMFEPVHIDVPVAQAA